MKKFGLFFAMALLSGCDSSSGGGGSSDSDFRVSGYTTSSDAGGSHTYNSAGQLTLMQTTESSTSTVLDAALSEYFENTSPNYEVAYYDLNNDGLKDAYVYINDRNWCGSGGCTSFIFKATQSDFEFQSKIMITKKPIIIAKSRSYNWFDIIVNTGRIGTVILKFDGKKYPLNPSMQPLANKIELFKGHSLLK